MRQVLFRIRLDDLWSLAPVDGQAAIGVGWLLLPWLVYGLWWAYANAGRLQSRAEWVPPVATWLGAALAVLTLPLWAGGLAPPDGLPIFGYGSMLVLGFLLAVWTAARRARTVGIDGEAVSDVALWILFGGIVGARLFYLVQYGDRIFAGKQGVEVLWAIVNLSEGGLVLYGGVILALAVFFLFCRRRRLSPLLMADVIMPSFFIGLAFGRLGCFLNGCCYGGHTHLPWGIAFPQGSVPFNTLVERGFLESGAAATFPLHPTQLYSAVNALVLAFLTACWFRARRRNGEVLALALLAYPATRFLIEYLRSDEPLVVVRILSGVFFGDEVARFQTPFTISQWVSLLLFASGVSLVSWLRRCAAADAADQVPANVPKAGAAR